MVDRLLRLGNGCFDVGQTKLFYLQINSLTTTIKKSSVMFIATNSVILGGLFEVRKTTGVLALLVKTVSPPSNILCA